MLQNFIIPQAVADPYIDEVILVGEWHEGEGYTYIPSPTIYRGAEDALHQRHAAAQVAQGDILIFQHDDHLLQRNMWMEDEIGAFTDQADVLSPARYTRLRKVEGERLNAGEPSLYAQEIHGEQQPGYISGHCAVYRREVIEACPWDKVPKQFVWDTLHTQQIRAAGFKIEWTEDLRCYDVEPGAEPWL